MSLAVAYRDAFREEIELAIEENRRPIEQLRELYPFIRVEASG